MITKHDHLEEVKVVTSGLLYQPRKIFLDLEPPDLWIQGAELKILCCIEKSYRIGDHFDWKLERLKKVLLKYMISWRRSNCKWKHEKEEQVGDKERS